MFPDDLPDTAAPGELPGAVRTGAPTRSARHRSRSWVAAMLVAFAVALGALLVGPGPAGAAPAASPSRAQDVGDDTGAVTSTTPTSSLLVPGDGTEGAESTTTTTVAATDGDDGLSDQSLVILVIVGLLVVALLVGLLTWRYWVATRPEGREPRRRGR